MSMFANEDPATLSDQLASLGFKAAEAKRFQDRLRQQRRLEDDAPSDQYPVVAFQGSEAAEFGPRLAVYDPDGVAWSPEGWEAVSAIRRTSAQTDYLLAMREAESLTGLALSHIEEIRGMGSRPGGAA